MGTGGIFFAMTYNRTVLTQSPTFVTIRPLSWCSAASRTIWTRRTSVVNHAFGDFRQSGYPLHFLPLNFRGEKHVENLKKHIPFFDVTFCKQASYVRGIRDFKCNLWEWSGYSDPTKYLFVRRRWQCWYAVCSRHEMDSLRWKMVTISVKWSNTKPGVSKSMWTLLKCQHEQIWQNRQIASRKH